MTLEIRPMTQAGLATAIGWAADAGWNPGLADAGPFGAEDPQGFLMGWLDGTPVASISVIRYGAGFGFLGFYIARPDYRGQGAQSKLLQCRLEDAAKLGCERLVVETAQETAEKPAPSYRNMVRYGFTEAYVRPNYICRFW